ncbi:hypothetical protein COB52_02675 [Candidatus Kaiserbacteria bacterium]|nr:MAG: hypothetical protein COB52_02675 [Candidatus Kaiserbacteria bacterium]
MSGPKIDTMDVTDWEHYLSNQSNTREISYHGGGNYLSIELRRLIYDVDSLNLYTKVVQATLNKWQELDNVTRVEWEVNPIHIVAEVAFGGRAHLFVEDLRLPYGRLWKESPRPHSETHKWIALNSSGELPVTRAELGLLFETPGWSLIATRVASKKGWLNDSIVMMEDLFKRKVELSALSIVTLVDIHGFPKEKGIRWFQVLGYDNAYTQTVVERWAQEPA